MKQLVAIKSKMYRKMSLFSEENKHQCFVKSSALNPPAGGRSHAGHLSLLWTLLPLRLFIWLHAGLLQALCRKKEMHFCSLSLSQEIDFLSKREKENFIATLIKIFLCKKTAGGSSLFWCFDIILLEDRRTWPEGVMELKVSDGRAGGLCFHVLTLDAASRRRILNSNDSGPGWFCWGDRRGPGWL